MSQEVSNSLVSGLKVKTHLLTIDPNFRPGTSKFVISLVLVGILARSWLGSTRWTRKKTSGDSVE